MSLKVLIIGKKRQDVIDYVSILIIVSIISIGLLSFIATGNLHRAPETNNNTTVTNTQR